MSPPTNSDHFAYYIAARRARAEAMSAAIQALFGLFRRHQRHAGWALAEAPRGR